MNKTKDILNKLKKDTNNNTDIIIRKKIVLQNIIYIVYNETLTSSDKISDFIIRSLDKINTNYNQKNNIDTIIFNEIENYKVKKINTYEDISYYINNGFTTILIEETDTYYALETRAPHLSRSINSPQTEGALRGAMDAFVENIQINMGLIRRRIKDNNLWCESLEVGRYTKTKVNILYMNNISKKEIVNHVKKLIEKIDIDGIISSGTIKNLIEKENKSVFPTIFSTERPDKVCQSLLNGRIVIMVDNSQFALLLPITMNDLFLSTEDGFNKSINISLTRIIRYVAFLLPYLHQLST